MGVGGGKRSEKPEEPGWIISLHEVICGVLSNGRRDFTVSAGVAQMRSIKSRSYAKINSIAYALHL